MTFRDGSSAAIRGTPGTLRRIMARLGNRLLPPGLRRNDKPLLPAKKLNLAVRNCRKALAEQGETQADWKTVRAVARRNAPAVVADRLEAFHGERPAGLHDLRLVSAFIGLQGCNEQAQRAYERLLVRYDPWLRLPEGLQVQGFCGAGVGHGSLNAYRRVTLNGQCLFEKIYLCENRAPIKQMLFAQRHLLPRLEGIRSPRLVHVAQGRCLAAAYFEWADLSVSQGKPLALAASLVRQLQRFDETTLPPEAALWVYQPNFLGSCRGQLLKLLGSEMPARAAAMPALLAQWQAKLDAGPRSYCHGDPSLGNLMADGWVVDWDGCGFLPRGFDAGNYLGRRHADLPWPEIVALYRQHFADPADPEADWRGFVFFFLHFMRAPASTQAPLLRDAFAALEEAMTGS
ncbi:MAG: phosphotransferase [Pararhodobacter sp.]|nr:phosphotransferase [Pararhodobacter sp.]